MGEVNPNISSHLHQESSFRDISQMVQQGDRDMDQEQYHPLQTANMTFHFMETVQQSAINRHVVDVSFYEQVKLDFQLNIIVDEDVFETLNSSTQMATAFAQPTAVDSRNSCGKSENQPVVELPQSATLTSRMTEELYEALEEYLESYDLKNGT